MIKGKVIGLEPKMAWIYRIIKIPPVWKIFNFRSFVVLQEMDLMVTLENQVLASLELENYWRILVYHPIVA